METTCLSCWWMLVVALSFTDALQFTARYGTRFEGNRTMSATVKFHYEAGVDELNSLFVRCGYSTDTFQTLAEKRGTGAVTGRGKAQAWTDPAVDGSIGFTLSNLQAIDQRKYGCQASGTGNIIDSQLVDLQVYDRPRFIKCVADYPNTIQAEEMLRFTCLSVGNPIPTLRCDLIASDGRSLQNLERLGNITNDGFSNLPVESHMIRCVSSHERTGKAETGLYVGECDISLDPTCDSGYPSIGFTHKPYAVKQFELVDHSEGTLRFRWLPVRANETGGAGDFHYEINYYLTELGVGNTTKVRVEQTNLQNPALDPFQYTTLTGLLHQRTYTVSIFAVNSLGKSLETKAANAATNPAARRGDSGSSNIGAIVGGVIGGVILIVVIVVLVIYCSKKKDQNVNYPTSYVDDVPDYQPSKGDLYAAPVRKGGSKVPSLVPSRAGGGSQTSGYPDVINASERNKASAYTVDSHTVDSFQL